MDDDNPYEIDIARLCGHLPSDDAPLVAAVRATLHRHDIPSAVLSIALVDDDRMASLNAAHLNHDGPTDVLSFDLRDNDGSPLEGELVLSVDTAAREAQQRGHALEAELMLYAVHGTLHLLGYDDHDEADALRMHTVEDEILTELGAGSVYRGLR